MEDTILRILKRFMLVLIGSGLLGNALYIHGLAYYEGYIERFGFDYGFFPLPSSDVLFWTYSASRELGVSSIVAITKFKFSVFLTILGSVYLLSRIWMESSSQVKKPFKPAAKKQNINLYKKIYKFREDYKIAFYVFYIPLRWLILKEQSLMAFIASYFSLIVLFFVPIFFFIWVYFPMVGLEHGKSVAESRIEYYKKNLCGDEYDYWSNCMVFSTKHIDSYGAPKNISGRLILRTGNFIGVFTESGPVTMSLSSDFYHLSTLNERYSRDEEKRITSQRSSPAENSGLEAQNVRASY